jgi:hypothetical protein
LATIRASTGAPALGLVGAHQHHRGGAVVERRRVAGGDRAVLGERRAQAGELGDVAAAGLLVAVDHGLAALTRELDRGDLGREVPAFCAASARR